MKKLFLIILILGYVKVFSQSCNEITKSFDKFTEVTTFSSPQINVGKSKLKDVKTVSITIHKKVSKLDTLYFLDFMGLTSKLGISSRGIIILMNEGNKIDEKDLIFELIEHSSLADIYYAKLPLTDKRLGLLKNHKITDIRLFAYNSHSPDDFVDISDEISSQIVFYLECLIKSVF